MRIDHKTLKKLYFRYLSAISPETRNDCPSPELLLKSIRGSLTRRKRDKIAEHVTSCIHCAKEFQALLDTTRQESEFISKMAGLNQLKNQIKEPSFNYIPKPIRRWPKVLAYTIPIIIAVSISAIFILQLPQKAKYRRARASPLQIIHPKESHADLSNLVFKWKELPDTEYYILDVFDESLLPVWTSPKVRGVFIEAPPPLIQKINKNETYFWMVTAFKKSGLRVESQLVEFYLNE